MGAFKGKVAIVTGAASGIGREISRQMGGSGAVIYAADINLGGATETASSITKSGGKAYPMRLDVTVAKDVKGLIHRVADDEGRLDYMFNNAGIAILGEVRDMDLDMWQRIIDVNLMGVVYGTTAAYEVMIKQGFGQIVNTASSAGLFPLSVETAYSTTKFGVVGLSTSLRTEAASFGVKVNVVCPGFVRTEIMYNFIALKSEPKDYLKRMPRMMSVMKAGKKILLGVRRNRPIITIGIDAKILWCIYRMSPAIFGLINKKMIKILRQLRRDEH